MQDRHQSQVSHQYEQNMHACDDSWALREMEEIKRGVVPKHVGFVMDGNRRWAIERNLPKTFGHRKGAKVLPEILPYLKRLGVQTVSAYAFSTENWKRSEFEVKTLFKLFKQQLLYYKKRLVQEGVCLRIIGDRSHLDSSLVETIQEVESTSRAGAELTCLLAINYGGRDEILRAFKKWYDRHEVQGQKIQELDEELFSSFLDTSGYTDPDLIIRTSGQNRLSNFLLWQSSYADLITVDEYWPDFNLQSLLKVMTLYQKNLRRYGGS